MIFSISADSLLVVSSEPSSVPSSELSSVPSSAGLSGISDS